MNRQYLIAIVLAIVVGGGGFFAGMKYQEGKRPNFARQFGNGQTMGVRNRNFRPVSGEIISQDDKSITVKLVDGSSKIVLLTDTTSISKSDEAAKTDLKVGEKVAAFGTENSDGSITAQNIQLNPVFR